MINKNSPSYNRLAEMLEKRDQDIFFMKKEIKFLKEYISELEKKNKKLGKLKGVTK